MSGTIAEAIAEIWEVFADLSPTIQDDRDIISTIKILTFH